ncbi:lytic transglycosylase, catalytic [Luminiphilus syltensis NOR5-1B]|uniref:Lytic transglycosylase, catalytic n=1 Tax=Luminiphilus syltensis NOR5-1B TaxID=565045 RepID=B8KYB5_9GAMM|nr:lytic transglycosylase, catalytic [Luminiphilus syltensis NOR5-1B]
MLLLSAAQARTETMDSREASRTDYGLAMAELRTGAGPRYDRLRARLADYPLVIYLDYEVLLEGLHDLKAQAARGFLERSRGSPLHNRFLHAYLLHKGKDRRWREFLAVLDTPPKDPELRCYYYRALWGTGDKQSAYAGAAALWNTGRSQEKVCDPLFSAWMEAGGPDDELVWSRALKAFDARSYALIRYLRRFASSALAPLIDELLVVYHRPDALVADAHQSDERHAQLMTVGIRRLARVNPEKGRRALENASSVQPFTTVQLRSMETMIARHSLFAKSAAPADWLQTTLARIRDDELTEIYLRNQLEQADWKRLVAAIDWLSDERKNTGEWRYWRAKAATEQGDTELAHSLLETLSGERHFHGFLAAEQIGRPFDLNGAMPEATTAASLPSDSGLDRVRELLALEELEAARLEWNYLLLRSSTRQRLVLAEWAFEQGMPRFTIDAANSAQAKNRVDLRFPSGYRDIFAASAERVGVDGVELTAIARRESALFPQAVSPVGARGLMQVMPATGREMARKLGLRYSNERLYDAEFNVRLASAYYRRLLDRYDGNRPKALAGYNAGPNRVDRWAQSGLSVDRWVDTLPFRETREYVRAVLAYAVIYKVRSGEPAQLLTASERSATY